MQRQEMEAARRIEEAAATAAEVARMDIEEETTARAYRQREEEQESKCEGRESLKTKLEIPFHAKSTHCHQRRNT